MEDTHEQSHTFEFQKNEHIPTIPKPPLNSVCTCCGHSLDSNNIGREGAAALADALRTNATLTKHMFAALRVYIDPTIAAISTIMILVSTILLLTTQFIGNRDKR